MALPFTPAQFLDVLIAYNLSVWPMQVLLFVVGMLISVLLLYPRSFHRAASWLLGALWLWMGVVYHFIFFTEINGLAYVFAVLFALEAVVFFVLGFTDRLRFGYRADVYGKTGVFFIVFALLVYPLLNVVFGHIWPAMPTFGLPCPTTIFTFGALLLTTRRVPYYVYIIPLLWSLIGVSAAINLGVWEDLSLLVAGIVGAVLLWRKDRIKKD